MMTVSMSFSTMLLAESNNTTFADDLNVEKVLIGEGADVHATENRARIALFGVCFLGHFGIVRNRIENHVPLVEAEPNSGWTPLHIASQEGHLNVVKFLVDSEPDINAKDKPEQTP